MRAAGLALIPALVHRDCFVEIRLSPWMLPAAWGLLILLLTVILILGWRLRAVSRRSAGGKEPEQR